MGASESTLSSSQALADEITTVSERMKVVDPILERLKSLKMTTPILTSPPADGSLTDILVRKPSASSAPAWQEEQTQKISKKQEEIEDKIEVADALAVKLHQRLNYSVSATRTTSQHLSEVHGLQVEIGELKGRLTEVISNCDALCERIATEGPESLRSSITPLKVAVSELDIISTSSSTRRDLDRNTPSSE